MNVDTVTFIIEKGINFESKFDMFNANILYHEMPLRESERLNESLSSHGFISCNMKFFVLPSVVKDSKREDIVLVNSSQNFTSRNKYHAPLYSQNRVRGLVLHCSNGDV